MMLNYYGTHVYFLKTIKIFTVHNAFIIICYMYGRSNGKVAFKVSELSQFPFMNDP